MDNKLTRNIQCPNCSQLFSVRDPLYPRGTRCPLILHCGHSVCENCIRAALRTSNKVVCGSCKQSSEPTQKNADTRLNFPLNIYLLGLFAAQHSRQLPQDSRVVFVPSGAAVSKSVQKAAQAKSATETCAECGEKKADLKCVQCAVPYCEHCFTEVHKAAKALAKHQKAPVDTSPTLCSAMLLDCSEHPAQKVEFYCKECAKMVCAHCVICLHQGHSVITKKQKNEEDLGELDSAREKAIEILKRMIHTQKKVTALCAPVQSDVRVKSVEQQIALHFLLLHGMLQLLEESLMEELRTVRTQAANRLETVKKDLATNIEAVQQLVQDALAAKDSALIDKVEVSAITTKLLDVQNLPCYLLVDDGATSEPCIKFNVDELFIKSMESHCELEVENGQSYTLVKTEDLPEDVKVEPIEEENERGSVMSVDSRSSSLSGLPERVMPSGEAKTDRLRKPNFRGHPRPGRNARGSSDIVTVCHLRTPSSFYVHRVTDSKTLEALEKELLKHVSAFTTPPETVMKDGLYMVQFEQDKKWYRARVKAVIPPTEEIKEEMADIVYIDYGNIEVIPASRLRCIPPRFAQMPAIAVHCSLFGVNPVNDKWTLDDITAMAKMVTGSRVKMVVMEVLGDTLEVDLCQLPGEDHDNDTPLSVRDAMVFLEHACFRSNNTMKEELLRSLQIPPVRKTEFFQADKFRKSAVVDVVVSHVETPHSFYVQRLGEHARYLTSIMKDMNNAYKESGNKGFIYTPYKGMPCAAQYSVDNNWYRAKIINLPGKKMVEVFYVDYGNQETVLWNQIRKLHRGFLEIASQAVHCSLTDIIPSHEGWTPAVKDFLVKTTAKKVLRLYVDDVQANHLKVTLYESQADVDLCINALLVRAGFATSVGVSSSLVEYHKQDGLPLPPQTLPLLPKNRLSKKKVNGNKIQVIGRMEDSEVDKENVDPFRLEVKVLSCPSPSCIYVALQSQSEQIKSLMCDLQEYYAVCISQPDLAWEVNNKCCAFSVRHKQWYRAIIIELLPDQQAKLFLKDFAEVEIVPLLNLQRLDPKFLQIRDGAVKCHLAGVKAAGDKPGWPGLACEYLQEQIVNYPEIYITKKGEIENWSLPVELWVKHVEQAGPLDPTEEEWITLNKKLTEQGLAIPLKREFDVQSIPSSQVLKELDEQSAEANKNSVSEWLQLSTQVDSSSKTESSEQVPEASLEESLSDIEDEAAELNSSTSTMSDWLPPLPLTKTKFFATPTYVDDDCYVYLHDTEKSADTLTLIGNALLSRFDSSQPKPHDLYWFPGQLCIAQYHSDKRWYRGKVIEVNEDRTVKVLFVDYGNVEECKATEMRKNIYMTHIPIQCHKCQLNRIRPASEDGKWAVSTLDFIHTTVVEKQCQVIIKEDPKIGQPIVIDLFGPGSIDIAELLVRMQFAIYTNLFDVVATSDVGTGDDEASVIIDETEPTEVELEAPSEKKPESDVPSSHVQWNDLIDLEECEQKVALEGKMVRSDALHYLVLDLPDCESLSVEVTAILSATEVVMHPCKKEGTQLFEMKEKFEKLMQDLQKEAQFQPLIGKPYIGQPCCSCYTEDEQWYRAVIIAVDIRRLSQAEVKVQYVDYGNVEIQPIDKVHILKPEWLEVPVQGLRCKLWNTEVSDDWKSGDLFSKLTECLQPPLIAKIKARQPMLEVELLRPDGTTPVWQSLVDAGLLLQKKAHSL